MNDDRDERRAEALAKLREAAEGAGLQAELFAYQTPFMTLFRNGLLVASYVPSAHAVYLHPGSRRVTARTWRDALEAARREAADAGARDFS